MLLSTVRSTPGGLGALEDEHLLDVALTRARLGPRRGRIRRVWNGRSARGFWEGRQDVVEDLLEESSGSSLRNDSMYSMSIQIPNWICLCSIYSYITLVNVCIFV